MVYPWYAVTWEHGIFSPFVVCLDHTSRPLALEIGNDSKMVLSRLVRICIRM